MSTNINPSYTMRRIRPVDYGVMQTRRIAPNRDPKQELLRIINAKKEADRRREEADRERIFTTLGKEGLFRLAYVPFVICGLVWDYADTILDMAAMKRIAATKNLCRAVRKLRGEYDNIRAPFIDNWLQASEERNMYVYENCEKDIVRQMLLNISIDLRSEYPALDDDWVQFLVAVYQCDITLKALLLYCDRQTAQVGHLLNIVVSHILPESVYKLDKIILEFTGDKPVSKKFGDLKKQYIRILATQMGLVEISELPD